jgi:hypothetical protein
MSRHSIKALSSSEACLLLILMVFQPQSPMGGMKVASQISVPSEFP